MPDFSSGDLGDVWACMGRRTPATGANIPIPEVSDGTCRTLDGETLALIHTEQLSLGADLVDYDRHAGNSMSDMEARMLATTTVRCPSSMAKRV